MVSLTVILFPMLISDMINPVLFAGMIFGLGSRHPFINSCLILISFFLSYFLAGIAIAVSLEALTDLLEISLVFDYILEFIVAIMLFIFAYTLYKPKKHVEDKLPHDKKMNYLDACLLGLQVNLIGLPFALPYLAAIDQILKSNLPAAHSILILLIYNALYILPFSLLILVRCYYQKGSKEVFEKLHDKMLYISERYLPVLFFILGLVLIEDCVSYFIGYREYSLLSLR